MMPPALFPRQRLQPANLLRLLAQTDRPGAGWARWLLTLAVGALLLRPPAASGAAAERALQPGVEPGQWVVVAAPAFAAVLEPLAELRRAEGLEVKIVKTTETLTAEQLHNGQGAPLAERLQALFGPHSGPKYLLLAGVGGSSEAALPDEVMVPPLRGATARMKGQLTDFGYGMADRAGLPQVAVGRLPARNLEEMKGMIAKILRLEGERERPRGRWRSRLLLVQGNPGGGGLAELFLESITKPRLERLHPAWELQVIAHNPSSAFYLPAPWLQRRTLEWLGAGELFAIYLGHSNPGGWSSLDTRFMSSADWTQLDQRAGPGVLFSCGCFGCQWDQGREQAYGLAAIRNPGGPVAVIGAYGESYAAPGLLAVDGLLRRCSEVPFPTRLGDYWLAVQAGLAQGELDSATFSLLDLGDGTGGKVPLAVQRQEHLEMWTLLGDPALRLPIVPLSISLAASNLDAAARTLELEGHLPEALAGAKVQVCLERSLGSRPAGLHPLPPASPQNAAERERLAAENQLKQNQRGLATARVTAEGRRFVCRLEIPPGPDLSGVVIRAVAESGADLGQGVLKWPLAGQGH